MITGPGVTMKITLTLFVGVVISVADASLANNDGINFFEKEIRPILVEHCYECHSAESNVQGGLQLDTRLGIEVGGDSGAVIVKGKPHASLLIEAVRYQNRNLQMPPQNALPPDAVANLERWIEMGAPDPRESRVSPDERPRVMSIPEGRKFWSFQPVSRSPAPNLKSSFLQNQVDAFILEKLQQNGLSPAPAADKRTLIRRVTQNLTGLPPTTAEVRRFLSDDSPQAFSKVIDLLLDSPQYGVRWGRHWLDVARYADSNGLDENIGFGNAWRYRDYVVNAFNADKPYDRFVTEQIAGDLLPDATRETITATAFLQLGPKVLAEPDIEKLHLDTIDEQIDTLGKAFLGMTFGCARCHDHKFDPIKQTDYYSLAAIFRSTKTFGDKTLGAIKYWYEHPIGTEDDAEHIATIDKELAALKSAASKYRNDQINRLRIEARSKATDYLVACLQFEPDSGLSEVTEIAESFGLHPRILYHCRSHLKFHRDNPFFSPWHQFAENSDSEAVRKHYSTILTEAETALADARRKNANVKVLQDDRLEAARAALYDNSGFLAVPTVDAFAFNQATLAEYHRLLSVARAFETTAPDAPELMSVSDGKISDLMPVFIRGNHNKPGNEVRRGLPAVMRWTKDTLVFPEAASGRLELANWMTSTRHPLTARVMVNRIWAWHFGEGLVPSTENFGAMGDRPSNLQLLDWLSVYFVESGWSVKSVHRLILNSATWQMASRHPSEDTYAAIDPANQFLWKQNLRRLEAEQIRDSILAVSGRLKSSLGGKTLPLRNRQFVFNHTSEDHTTYESLRHAIYLPVIRNNLYSLFAQFDFPDPTMPTGKRGETIVAPQALVLLNDPLVLDSAEAMAQEILRSNSTAKTQVHEIYERCYGREPNESEMERGVNFLDRAKKADRANRLMLFCQSILCSNEFIYIK